MAQRITGKNFDITVGDFSIHVQKMTLDLEDNSAVTKSGGIPDGWADGDVGASGEIEVDAQNLDLFTEAAKAAGSFRELPLFDILCFGKTADNEMKVEAFGCKLQISSLLDIDPNGGEKHVSKLPFFVTSPDFIRLNGVPYLSEADTEGL